MDFCTTGKPIGVGIIGLSAKGGWAAAAHVPALRAVEGYELRALSASSAESAAAAGQAYEVPLTFGTADELVRRDEVDLVVITVKVPHHHELVTTALQAGKMVLCEWPLGNGLAEAGELATLARSRGIRTVAGLQARSAPAIRNLRDLVTDGYVGEVQSTTIIASGEGWGPEVPTPHRYLIDAANGATMLTIQGGHVLDAAALVLGEFSELNAVVATRQTTVRDAQTGGDLPMTAPDQVAVTGQLAGGAVAAAHFRGGRSRGVNFHWEINGTDGDLVVSGPSGMLQVGAVQIRGGHDGGDGELPVLEVPGSYHWVADLAGQQDTPAYTVAHAYAQLLDDIENGTPTLPDFDHAVRRHRMIETIDRAATSGRRQTLP